MDLVVDTSVLIAVVANEPEKQALIERTAGADLIAPPSIQWEIGNAFSAMVKQDRVTLAKAKAALDAYRRITVRFSRVELARAMELCDEFDVYAYDAYMIACAEKEDCPLLTLDGGLKHSAERAGIDLVEVSQ